VKDETNQRVWEKSGYDSTLEKNETEKYLKIYTRKKKINNKY
jgi:hypothetical protein